MKSRMFEKGGDPSKPLSVNAVKLYKCLEVGRHASQATIKKAYRRLAIRHYPDKGGNAERFKEISHAYQILRDPSKRERYNEFGDDVIKHYAIPEAEADDIFNDFFGTGNNRQNGGRAKTRTVVHELRVTLEQMYTGGVRKVAINREVIDSSFGVRDCRSCSAIGRIKQQVNLGADSQEIWDVCASCQGMGQIWKPKKDREVVELRIEKGAIDGQQIVLKGKADQKPNHVPGDIVFVLFEEDHPTFTRKEADLYVERSITLSEALAGFSFEVTHLDGRRLRIKSKSGEVMQPRCIMDRNPDFDYFEDYVAFSDEAAETLFTNDVGRCKKICSRKGYGGFYHWKAVAYFLNFSRDAILSTMTRGEGIDLYVCPDPKAVAQLRMRKAVQAEGMPCYRQKNAKGNLFLLLNVVYPTKIEPESISILKQILPGPKQIVTPDPNYELHLLADIDPYQSAMEDEARDEEVVRNGHRQCQQQ